MAYLNKVFLIGRLSRDPEFRVTPRGTAICAGSIAVSRQFKDESGQIREEVAFIDFEAWAKTAELISKYLSKGQQTMLEGHLKMDSWEDKQTGQKRSKLKVVVGNVQFLENKSESHQPDARQDHNQEPPANQGKPFRNKNDGGMAYDPSAVDDSDVPF